MSTYSKSQKYQKDKADPFFRLYIASQVSSVGHSYNRHLPIRPVATKIGNHDIPEAYIGRSTPDVYGDYDDSDEPYYVDIGENLDNFASYFNVGDFALANNIWGANQDLKPDIGWHYIPEGNWFRLNFDGTELAPIIFPKDGAEILAYIAEAHSKALGASRDSIAEEIDTNAKFNFGDIRRDHSAQFLSTNMVRQLYWFEVLLSFGLLE